MLSRYKKSWKYIKKEKKYLFLMIFALIIFQITAMLSPLIIQRILDDNILIIDDTWYEVKISNDNLEENNLTKNNVVEYNEHYYMSSKKMQNTNAEIDHEVSIVYSNGRYYFIDQKVSNKNGTIKDENFYVNNQSYPAQKMNTSDIQKFYSPIIDDTIKLCILLLIILFINLLFSYFQRMSGAFFTINTTKNIRIKAAKKLEYINIANIENDPAGKLANRFLNDSLGIADLYTSTVNVFISSVLAIVLSFIGMYILSPKIATIILIIVPILVIWINIFVKNMKKIAQKMNETNSLIIAQVNEIINGIFILKIFNTEKKTMDKFAALNDQYLDESMEEISLHLSYGWNGINLFQGIFIGGIICLFGILDVTGLSVVQAGVIYAFYNYLNKIISPVNLLFHEFSKMEHATVKFERILKILESPSENSELKNIPPYRGDIEFKHVNFQYNNSNKILKDINLNIKSGQKIGVVGRSGAGKSTLINLLLRFNELNDNSNNSGEILIDNTSIYTNTKRTYRTHIGIILQEPIIFQGTLYTNIKMNKDVEESYVLNVLKHMGGERILQKFNNDINTPIKDRGANLSLGEKQLISFARALVQNPQILIMDEATANIDTETEQVINKSLEVISQNRTVIIIAHRLSTIKNCDNIVVMADGEIKEIGTHTELITKHGKYHEMWMNQN